MAVANHWILQDMSGDLILSLERLFCRGQRGQGWWDMSRSRDLDCEGKQESRIENPPSTSVSSRPSWGPGAQENQEFLSCSWYIATFLSGWEVVCSQTDWIPGTLYIQKWLHGFLGLCFESLCFIRSLSSLSLSCQCFGNSSSPWW